MSNKAYLIILAGLTSFATLASAQLLVYESFAYYDAAASRAGSDLLHLQPDFSGGDAFPDIDATGLSGVWTDTDGAGASTDLFMKSGSLAFADLSTLGNHVAGDTNNNKDEFNRPIAADLAAGSDLWFSFLADQLDTRSAANEGIVIGNQVVTNAQIPGNDGTDGLAGFGVGSPGGGDWAAYAWDGTSQGTGSGDTPVSGSGTATDNGVIMLVGHISFNTGTAGADVYKLYYYDLNGASSGTIQDNAAYLTQIGSTIEVDVDEAASVDDEALDTLNVTRQVNTAFDEIRIGQTLADVLGLGADTTAPSLAALDPLNGATDVLVFSDLVATFNENVVLTGGGSVTIKNLDDGSGSSDIVIPLPNGQVTEANDLQIVISPSSDLAASTNFAVLFSNDAVEDEAGNDFGGILLDTDWGFTTAEADPPIISSLVPADDATGVSIDNDLVVTFSEDVILTGNGTVTIKNTSDTILEVINLSDARVTLTAANELTINPADPLLPSTNYSVLISSDALTDVVGNPFAGLALDTDWNFTTEADLTPPTIVTKSPVDEASNVVLGTQLVATFDELVAIGTGNITIRNLTDGAGADVVIDVTDASQVSVLDDTLTVNPTSLLLENKDYAVQIQSGAIVDLAANDFGGITNDLDWNFSTATSVVTGLLVYEGYQYNNVGDLITGEPDGAGTPADIDATGLTGVWAENTSLGEEQRIASGSLTFGDLPTAGNHIASGTDSNDDAHSRELTTSALASVGSVNKIWFSLIMRPVSANSVSQEGFGFTNQALTNPLIPNNSGGGLIGFGIGADGGGNSDWRPYVWDGTTVTAGSAELGTSNGTSYLLVGEISFNTGTNGADEYKLYNVELNAGSLNGALLTQIGDTLEVNLDQTTLDTVNLTRRRQTSYDELRVGTSLTDVVPGYAPDTTAPAWEATYPQVTDVDETSAIARAAINENGTAYYVVLADGAPAPTSAQVQAGTDGSDAAALDSGSIALTATTENTAAISGLTASTAYDIYFVAEDPSSNLQASPALVEITTLSGSVTYATWSGGADADVDTNGDGVLNAVAYALGAADPNADATALLPTSEYDDSGSPTYLVFTFNRDDAAEADVTTAISVEYGSDLSGWTTAVNDPGGTGVLINETGSDPTNVEVKIPVSLAVGDKLFARLRVVVTP